MPVRLNITMDEALYKRNAFKAGNAERGERRPDRAGPVAELRTLFE
jgi:hypothetical protein